MHPAVIFAATIAAILEFWVVFAVTYAALQRYDGRRFGARVKDALRFPILNIFRVIWEP